MCNVKYDTLNNSKIEVLTNNAGCRIMLDDEAVVKVKSGIIYLGALLAADGKPQGELNRRIGAAGKALDELAAVWRHANIPRKRKLYLLDACVISRLLYGLQVLWLNEAELKRLDAFYIKCLRKILDIFHFFISRVSNIEVLIKAERKPIRYLLLERQMRYYEYLVKLPDNDSLRNLMLIMKDVRPVSFNFKKRGAPKHCWINCIF